MNFRNNNPVLFDSYDEEIKIDETRTIHDGIIDMGGLPDSFIGVTVYDLGTDGKSKIKMAEIKNNQTPPSGYFYIDYLHGWLKIDPAYYAKHKLKIEFYSRGIELTPASRIYSVIDCEINGGVIHIEKTLQDYLNEIYNALNFTKADSFQEIKPKEPLKNMLGKIAYWYDHIKNHILTYSTGSLFGHVKLSDSINSTSSSASHIAATPNAIKTVKDALDEADNNLSQSINSEARTRANADVALGQRIDSEITARTNADNNLSQQINNHSAVKGNNTTFGHVKLSDAVNSTSGSSSNIAATPKAVKQAYDKASEIINTERIADGAITNEKIANGAVKSQNIANNAVTPNKLSYDLQNKINNINHSLDLDTFKKDVYGTGDINIEIENAFSLSFLCSEHSGNSGTWTCSDINALYNNIKINGVYLDCHPSAQIKISDISVIDSYLENDRHEIYIHINLDPDNTDRYPVYSLMDESSEKIYEHNKSYPYIKSINNTSVVICLGYITLPDTGVVAGGCEQILNVSKTELSLTGTLDNLQTKDKSSIIGAVNENSKRISDNTGLIKKNDETIKELNSKFNAYKTYMNEVITEMNNKFIELYDSVGIVLYDGGLFNMIQNSPNFDGGAFTDTDLISFDCGGFTKTVGSIDGGTY